MFRRQQQRKYNYFFSVTKMKKNKICAKIINYRLNQIIITKIVREIGRRDGKNKEENTKQSKKKQCHNEVIKINRFHQLPQEIVQTILEFTGIVENYNDYRLMKIGLHEMEEKTINIIKQYLIKRLIASRDEDFIKNIKYLYDNNEFFLGEETKKRMKYFLECTTMSYITLFDETREEYIKHSIEWAKETNPYYYTSIMSHLCKEKHHIFTPKLIKHIL